MSFFQRILISIIRNKKRNIAFTLLIFLFGSVIASTVLLNQAFAISIQNIKDNMTPRAMITRDIAAHSSQRATLREQLSTSDTWDMEVVDFLTTPHLVTLEMIRTIASLPYVYSYEYHGTINMFVPKLNYLEVTYNGYSHVNHMGERREDCNFNNLHRFIGVSSPDFMEIEEGIIEIVAGRTFTHNEIEELSFVTLVSREYALYNQISLGSTVTLLNPIFDHADRAGRLRDMRTLREVEYEAKVIGIFQFAGQTSMQMPGHFNATLIADFYNRFYVPISFFERIGEDRRYVREQYPTDITQIFEDVADFENYWSSYIRTIYWEQSVYEHSITLNSPEDMMPFLYAADSILPDFFLIQIQENDFPTILSALNGFSSLSTMILMFTLLSVVLMIGLFNLLMLRNRKHEMGIYLSLGSRKKTLCMQLLLEQLGLALVGLLLALFVGYMIGVYMSDVILLRQLADSVAQHPSDELNWFFMRGMGDGSVADAWARNYEVAMTSNGILTFFGLGMGAIVLSHVVSMAFIMRLKPKKIML